MSFLFSKQKSITQKIKFSFLIVFFSALLGRFEAYASQMSADEQTETKHSLSILTVKPFSEMHPINRGYTKEIPLSKEKKIIEKKRSKKKESLSDSGKLKLLKDPLPAKSTILYALHVMAKGDKYKSKGCSCVCGGSGEDLTLCGITRLRRLKSDEDDVRFFSLPSQDKRIGRFSFKDLLPETEYEIQFGQIFYGGLTDLNSSTFDWTACPPYVFQTPPAKPRDINSFVYGSCNRVGLVGGIELWRDKGSKMFRTIAQDIEDNRKAGLLTDAFITLGDWVYLDATGEWTAATTFDEMVERYMLVNTTEGATRLFETFIPVHQMADDHERQNDWHAEVWAKTSSRAQATQRAYDLFQRPQGSKTPHPWFTIADNLEGFVMDLRTEMYPSQNRAISDEQMQALKDWLIAPGREKRIKPVFMSTTALTYQGDPWQASPDQLIEILNFIISNKIKYVAFFTGDIHVGKSGLWQDFLDDEKKFFIFEDASSAFHKISSGKGNLLSSKVNFSRAKGPMLWAEGRISPTIWEDHFTRIILDHTQKTVEVIKKDRKNNVLLHTLFNLKTGKIDDVEPTSSYKTITSLNTSTEMNTSKEEKAEKELEL